MKSVPRLVGVVLVTWTLFYGVNAPAKTQLPNPVLRFTGQESVESGGKQMMRFHYDVFNYDAYPDEMFAASPALPPCGKNAKASRTWIDIYEQSGKRLNGFCAFSKSSDLNSLWFSLEGDSLPPSWVYIEMTDRLTKTTFKSNLAETTQ